MNVNSLGLKTNFRNRYINRLKTKTENKIKNETGKNWKLVYKIETETDILSIGFNF